eukprot:Pgem_evm1s16678
MFAVGKSTYHNEEYEKYEKAKKAKTMYPLYQNSNLSTKYNHRVKGGNGGNFVLTTSPRNRAFQLFCHLYQVYQKKGFWFDSPREIFVVLCVNSL